MLTEEKPEEMNLVKDGVIGFSIILSENANAKEKAAALDLKEIMSQICGDSPEILSKKRPDCDVYLLVGESEYTKELGFFRLHGFPEGERVIVKTIQNNILFMGNDDGSFSGTEFAVTMFLEKIGCGWFGPDKLWQVIPKRDSISIVFINIDHNPQFVTRETNVLRANPDVGKRWYQGGVPKVIGHALTGLVPREEYFEKHPEWFCMIEGIRNPFVQWWQYCYSNEDLPFVFAEKLGDIFNRNPQMTQYSIAANDGWYHGWCECEKCMESGINNAERYLNFVNRLAREVAKKYPKHILTLLSYFPTYYPPSKKMMTEPNVEIMFCKESDMFSPVDKGPDNGYHLKYEFPQSKNRYLTPWKENFEKWLEMVDCKHIAIWDWYCIAASSPIWKDIPWVQGDVITRNHRYWHDHGVAYIYNDQGPLDVFYEDDRSFPLRWPLWYVHAKGMWDKDLTGSDILYDACKKLYDEAADSMFSFYNCLADIARCSTARSIAWHPPKPGEVYTESQIKRVDLILSVALHMAAGLQSDVKDRIRNQYDLWENAKGVICEN